MRRELLSVLAIAAGVMLAVCIDLNSSLSAVSSPIFASWVAHGIGAVTAALLIAAQFARSARHGGPRGDGMRAPVWSYLGGVPGGFAVVLAILIASTSVGFSTTISLMIAGQICFGVASDRLGLFGLERRKLRASDLTAIALIAAGSMMLVYMER